MSKSVKPARQNRTITVDFLDETTYHQLCGDGPRFIDFVTAFILSIGFQLKHPTDGRQTSRISATAQVSGSPAIPTMRVFVSTGFSSGAFNAPGAEPCLRSYLTSCCATEK